MILGGPMDCARHLRGRMDVRDGQEGVHSRSEYFLMNMKLGSDHEGSPHSCVGNMVESQRVRFWRSHSQLE